MSIFRELEKTMIDATSDLFAAYSLSCRHDGPASGTFASAENADTTLVVSTIGFASEQVRGGLVLVASRDVVRELAPDDGDTDAIVCDVLGEFANMLLGRIKNRLLARGHRILFGTGSNAIVHRISIGDPGGLVAWHRFNLGSSRALRIRLDATIERGFVMGTADSPREPAFLDGKVTLF